MKPWYLSKIIWLGVLQIAISAIQLLPELVKAIEQAHGNPTQLTNGIVFFLTGVGTIVLRSLTNKGIQ